MEINDFLTLDYLATYAGAVMVTMLMVQFLKELPLIKKVPTKYFTFVVAFLNILICSILLGNFVVSDIYLIFINSVLITLTATGGYDFSINRVVLKEQHKVE